MLASLFPAITLTHGQHVDLDWPAFAERYLTRHDVRRRKDGRLFSFAIYHADPHRSDTNVRAMAGIVLDFDNKVGEGNDAHCSESPTLPDHHFGNLGDITYAWYSTHQNSPEWPRWRLVFPLDREVLPHEWPAVFDGALAMLGRDENIDGTCGELSRAYYTPSCTPELEHEAFSGFHEGRLCSVDELLSMSSVVIGDNVRSLPGANQRNQGRNDKLKGIASAMLGRGEPVEAIVLELLKVDAEHNPPLFSDRTEGYKGTPEAGALKFLGSIALSQSARSRHAGKSPDEIVLRALGQAVPPLQDESLLVLACDLPAVLKPPQWLVEDYFEANALSVLFGEPGAGKSFIALDLALSIACGQAWHGQPIRQTPVIYLCGEGHAGLQRRMHAWREWHQTDWRGAPFAMSKRAVPLSSRQAIETLKRDIDALVDRLGDAPGLFVVDTLARNFGPGDENSTKDMTLFVDLVGAYLIDAYKAGVMLVHHTGHGDKQRARGSSSLKGAVDAEYFVQQSDARIVELSGLKMKDAPLPQTLHFGMRVMTLGEERPGKPMTSVVPVPVAPAAASGLLHPKTGKGGKQEALYDVLASLYAEARRNLEMAGRDVREARIEITGLRDAAFARDLFAGQYRRQRFADTLKSLEEAGLVFVDRPFVMPRDAY